MPEHDPQVDVAGSPYFELTANAPEVEADEITWVPPSAEPEWEPPEVGLPDEPHEAPAEESVPPSVDPEPAPAAAATPPPTPRPVAHDRTPRFALGATLYPLDAETQRPDEWYSRDQSADLAEMGGAGFALSRVLVSWNVIEPQVGQYDGGALSRLTDVVATAREHRIKTIVCLFADDRQAELTAIGWSQRRDPLTDGYLLQRETALVARVVSAFAGESGVFGWQLGNEAFLSGFTSSAALEEWTRLMREAIREVDPDRPITLGIDAETFLRATGVDARAAIETCEFSVSHVTSAYRAYAAEGPVTSGPSTYLDSFLLRLADRGKPVLADDIGPLSLDSSPAEEAAAVRTALWSVLGNRADGALLRRFRDFETERREPYFLDPFETLVGIVDDRRRVQAGVRRGAPVPRPAGRRTPARLRADARANGHRRTCRALRAAAQPRRAFRPESMPDRLHRGQGGASPCRVRRGVR